MNKNIKISLLLVSLLGTLHAQETYTLEPLTIDSTAIKTDELKSTDAVEVYTAQDIQKAHAQNLYEFLNEQTSVVTLPSYGNTFAQLIDFHGYGISNGYQNVVVTLDGRRLNNIDGVPQLLSMISPDTIERIEIVKSSGIVTGGDGANAGSINIITKQGDTKEVSFYGGSYGTADGSFTVGHTDDKLSISANGEARKFDGIRAVDTQGNKDKNRFSTGNFKLAYTPSSSLELRLGADFAREDLFYAGGLTKAQYEADPAQKGSSSSSHQLYDADAINAGMSYYFNDKLSLDVDAAHEKKRSEYISIYGDNVSHYDYNSAKTALKYKSAQADVTLGADLFDGTRKGGYYQDTISKKNAACFLAGEYRLENDTFKAGYRLENVSYVYDKTSTHLNKSNTLHGVELGYNHRLDKTQSLFADYSHTYLSPVVDSFFNEYTGSFNGFINPMQANNYTVGYNNIQNSNKFKLSAYYIALVNEIYYNPASYINTNIDSSHKYGLDLYDKYLINDTFNITLNYNYVQAIIDKEVQGGNDYSTKQLPGVSNHNIKATLSYLPNPFTTLALTQIYRSEAYATNDFSNSFSQKQDTYMSTDLSATYAKKTYELFAKITNLFNQKNGIWIQDNSIYPVNFTTTAIAGLKLKF